MSQPPPAATTVDPAVLERMQREWDGRAREDAHFYVAFGRRDQDDEEFFATAAEVVHGLEWEMRRLDPAVPAAARRALEIGCGPGRLMRPMSRHFGEIHGVDVSAEMIERAKRNLGAVPHAHPHAGTGATLPQFASSSFDFVYSYAVFQHIPSREVVFSYLEEAHRVMKPGAILRVQINGLPESARSSEYTTWSGVRISAADVQRFTREHDFQLLALEGAATQYMWTTWRKREPGWWQGSPLPTTRIRRITNAHSSEPAVPTSGRYASISLWIEDLPENFDLNHCEVRIGGAPGFACYIGPRESDGLQQLNVILSPQTPTGLPLVEIDWNGRPLCAPGKVRVTPPGPQVPRLLSAVDGINMLSGVRLLSRSVKVTIEDANNPEEFEASIDGTAIPIDEIFLADPLPPRYEINFRIPESLPAGHRRLAMRLGRRTLPPVDIEIADVSRVSLSQGAG